MVSAFAAGQRLALGQVRVADKTNEIVPIPDLPERISADPAWFECNRPLNTRRQAAFGAASRFAVHVQGSSSSRCLGSWLRMRPRMSLR
jgi:hypothetical protein